MLHYLKPIIYKEYSYLFNEIKCPICGKIFTLNYDKILRTYRNLKKNLNVFLCCSSSCSSKYMLQKLGNPSKLQWVKDKKEKTFYKNYGCRHNWASKDPNLNGRATCKERYGKEYFTQTEQYHNLWKDKERTKKIIEKQYKTKEKNGTLPGNIKSVQKLKNTFAKRTKDDWKKIVDKQQQTKIKNGTITSNPNIQQKRHNTMKKNHTFNSSKIENICNIKLKSKFPDVVHHYSTDSRYPFECDFYIPSKDLFIELNFHWTHGKEPFDKNNSKHKIQLDLWKSKNTKFYNKAIEVWTKRDILKLETFKKNNLNYKIFYNQNIFEEWLNNVIDSTR